MEPTHSDVHMFVNVCYIYVDKLVRVSATICTILFAEHMYGRIDLWSHHMDAQYVHSLVFPNTHRQPIAKPDLMSLLHSDAAMWDVGCYFHYGLLDPTSPY